MPKLPKFTYCLDEVKQVSISHLTSLGFLRPNAKVVGAVGWSIGGEPSGSITIEANLQMRYVELRYIFDGTPINDRVLLEGVKRHFGGEEWYFVCPTTGKRCKKLYYIDGSFRSRFAYPSAIYTCQTYSKTARAMIGFYSAVDGVDQFHSKPYSRTHYNGKITKRFARFLERERRASRLSSLYL